MKAQVGNLVLAFSGRRLGTNPHGVRWAGLVAEKLTFEEYWIDNRFASKKPGVSPKPDNFYRPTAAGLESVPNSTHGPERTRTDIGGQYVLVFRNYWRFGNASPVIPQHFGLRMTRGRRGHRVAELGEPDWNDLRNWLSCPQREQDQPMVSHVSSNRRSGGCS